MSFSAEPAYRHGQRARTAVLLVNLGTPDAPEAPALRRYLAEFLSDPRVVEIPRIAWWPILHGIILNTRPAKSAAKYTSVWMPEGSPLAVWTRRQAEALAPALQAAGHDVLVRHAMRYGNPSVASVLDGLRAEGATRVLVLPLYPQYAAATTASVGDAVMKWALKARRVPELRFIGEYHDHPGYIDALADRLQRHWAEHGRGDKLVLSFHGLRERSLTLGDPYHCQCHVTARLLAETLGLSKAQMVVTFQSRFGKAKWLEPYTEPTLVAMARRGVRRVDVMCPGFVADCLETLEEISQEARAAFLEAGGEHFGYVPCVNDSPLFVRALADLAMQHLQGWDTRGPSPEGAAAAAAQRARALAMGATD
ncbi:MAG: ferrochelatase [Leptothrix sp. (in: Bacteria)]|nr:ferrochelatase [Leptothrix sp. (in: b-proteobacteria)]